MKIALESTATIVVVDGVPTRKWVGTSETGERIVAFIPLIGYREKDEEGLELAGLRPLFDEATEHLWEYLGENSGPLPPEGMGYRTLPLRRKY